MDDERERPKKRRRARVRPAEEGSSGEFPASGRPFGRYHLLKRLSYGGMGEIFLAKHDGIGGFSKLLVIKRLLPHFRGDPDVVAMFFDEAKLQALMSDRHIVQIWDMGKVEEQYFIAMEYVEGTSWRRLGERLKERGEVLHPAHAVDLVVQACRGLGYAHNLSAPDGRPLSLVHRDVNPQNVLVSFSGECKLIDFGIAKSELSGHHTETGTIKGKFAYMSPEQARAEPLDRRSDIFSMGICLYELLAGVNPFHRQNVVLSLEAICEHSPPPLEKVRPDAAVLAPVIERCIAKGADDRFASCTELEDALVSLYVDGFFGEPSEPLEQVLQRLFAEEMEEQGAFLREHGFSSLTSKKVGPTTDTGSASPYGLGADVTKRTALRRSQSGPSSFESAVVTGSSRSGKSAARGKASAEADTHPTATLALASLPSRTGERPRSSLTAASPAAGDVRVSASSVDFAEDTEVPELSLLEAPRRSLAARLTLLVALALLLSLSAALGIIALSDGQTLDALLAALDSSAGAAADELPARQSDDSSGIVRAPDGPASPAALDAGSRAEVPAGAETERPDDEAPLPDGELLAAKADAGAAAGSQRAEEERDPVVADDAPELRTGEAAEPRDPGSDVVDDSAAERTARSERDRTKTGKRRPARPKRADEVTSPVSEEPVPENAAVIVGVLTVNAGGPFAIAGKGVRGKNVAKAPLEDGEVKNLTISGGPVKVKLRVTATAGGVEVRLDSEPWTIVRANNLGRGRTPQTLKVRAGEPLQLVLKHPEAGEMKVTLGFSRRVSK